MNRSSNITTAVVVATSMILTCLWTTLAARGVWLWAVIAAALWVAFILVLWVRTWEVWS